MPWWAWIVLGIGLLAVELFFVDAQFYLVFIGLSAAAVGLLGLAGVHLPEWSQWLAFAVLALVTMLTFRKRDGRIFLFWSAEGSVDTVWPYWNLMDFTPEGRPDRLTPPQKFTPEFFEKHILKK